MCESARPTWGLVAHPLNTYGVTMMKKPHCVAVLIALSLLSGCASTSSEAADGSTQVTEDALMTSDADRQSIPAFLSTPQEDDDLLPPEGRDLGVDPASTRLQGEWREQTIYLAVQGANDVQLLVGDEDAGFGVGGGSGNSVLGHVAEDGSYQIQYVPQGTSDIPDGWTALSDFVMVK